MRILLLAVGVVFLSFLAPNGHSAYNGRITVTATIVSSRVEGRPIRQGVHRSTHLRLWNYNITERPIGYALITCAFAGSGGVLGGGVWTCNSFYRFPLGSITAAGVQHSQDRFTCTITGGSGRYNNQGGIIFVKRIGPGTLHVVMKLA